MFKIKLSLILLLTAMSFSVFSACHKETHPITAPNSYYSHVEGLSGQELHIALNDLVKGHKKYSYTPCVWAMLKEADEDPLNANNVITIYTNRSIAKSRQDNGSNDSNSWNREHIWAKSHGFPQQKQHAYTDGHHLRAADRSVNSDRSDNDFANGGTEDEECVGCFEGKGTWEPPTAVKGDIARMMFYMSIRYDGNDMSKTPDLILVDRDTERVSEFGRLCTLMQWHINDQVSPEELARNNVIESWQGNRNPFIDRPIYAQSIWGNQCNLNRSIPHQKILEQIERLEQELVRLKALIK